MPAITMITGLLLVIIGLSGYVSTVGEKSMTALIPAAFGVLIGLCGILGLVTPFRKHVMHAAAMFALLGMIGGFVPLFKRSFDFSQLAVQFSAFMIVICAMFLLICIRSFVQARVLRDRDRSYSVQG